MAVVGTLALVGVLWTAPPQCPSSEEVDAKVAGLSSMSGDTAFRAVANVRTTDAGFAATLRIAVAGRDQTRELAARTCDVLADAVALVIAVEVDAVGAIARPKIQRALGAPVQPQPEPDVQPPRPTQPLPKGTAPSAPPLPPAPRERAASRWRGTARVEVGAANPALPRFGLAVAVAGGARLRRLALEVQLLHGFVQARQRDAPADDQGLDVRLWAASARAGFVPRVAIVEFPLRLGFEAGDVVATGTGVSSARTRHGLWLAVAPSAGVSVVPIPRLALTVDVGTTFALSRPSFGFGEGGARITLHEVAVFGLRALLGLEVRFP